VTEPERQQLRVRIDQARRRAVPPPAPFAYETAVRNRGLAVVCYDLCRGDCEAALSLACDVIEARRQAA
jgi:hypothetical protein